MFDIALDECGRTCKADELVRDKCAVEIGNTRKRRYFCVACVGEKHPVFLNVRHEASNVDKKARNYTALAWFSHHGGGGTGNSGQDTPSRETARHWQAKHILSQHVGLYYFTASKCKSCTKHTTIEDGAGAIGKVEFPERTSEGALYRFDAALLRGNPGSVSVSSVLEVWATHKTSKEKRQYCLDQGYMFGEFDAETVLDAHRKAPPNTTYELKNLSIRYFECSDCANAKEQAAIFAENVRLVAIAVAEKARVLAEHNRLLAEADEAHRNKQMLSDKEFYNETCTGAETRILQLQTELYEQFAVLSLVDSVRHQGVQNIELDVYEFNEDDILCIGNPVAWRDFHRKKEQKKALLGDIEIANGSVHLKKTIYEKGVSFKCICNKWIHPSSQVLYSNKAMQRSTWVDVYKEQVHPTRFEFIVQNGIRQHYSFGIPYVKLCGLCANYCIFCEKGIEQTQASGYGCCYPCFRDVPGNIERMQAKKRRDIAAQITLHEDCIAQIHAGDAFRGFLDFATEHRLLREGVLRIERQKQQEINDDLQRLQHRVYIETQTKFDEEKTKRDKEEKKMADAKWRSDETKKQNDLAHINYEMWALAQADHVRKRKERDQQSHDRWILARRELQKTT